MVVQPGGWYFGYGVPQVETLLGSCVAVTAWHPRLHSGGMCHFLLPSGPKKTNTSMPNPRYGVDALELLTCAMMGVAPLHEYLFGVFGGAEMFSGNQHIGERNVRLVEQWMTVNDIIALRSDVGGKRGRRVYLDMENGLIDVKFLDLPPEMVHIYDN